MKTCELCKTILPDDPYRETAIVASINKSRSLLGQAWSRIKRIQAISWLANVVVNALLGCLGVTGLWLAGWLIFIGAYKLGVFICLDFFGWEEKSVHWEGGVPPVVWLIGMLTACSPLLVPWLGSGIRKSLTRKKSRY